MKHDRLIKATNNLAIILIVIMIYWVFIFIVGSVFSVKIFKENITELFGFSILGILAVLAGAVILNVMLNMTKLANAISDKTLIPSKPDRWNLKAIILIILSFVIITGIMFVGDYVSDSRKKRSLLSSAKNISTEYSEQIKQLSVYSFDSTYISNAESILSLISKQEEHFLNVSIILEDTLQGKSVPLEIEKYYVNFDSKVPYPKEHYVFRCSKEERAYLSKVFHQGVLDLRFTSSEGHYELFFPVKTDNRIIVFYFTDYNSYGDYGS